MRLAYLGLVKGQISRFRIIKIQMYLYMDWTLTVVSLGITIILPILYSPALFLIGIIFYLLYPIPMEIIYNLTSCSNEREFLSVRSTAKVVYSNNYNITACGIEKLHSFDSCKYGNIMAQLNVNYQEPIFPSRRILLELGVSRLYLLKLCYSAYASKCVEIPICFLPSAFVRQSLLNPMLLATGGTLTACMLALQNGFCVNLSGGYHHATFNSGGGFCIYPDIQLAVKFLHKKCQIDKIMIVDLDAHQGNGYETDLVSCFIIDFYNHNIYPGDVAAKQNINIDIKVNHMDSDEDYLRKMEVIKQSITDYKPQFIIYNAGTDTLDGDPLGGMSLSEDCIIKRDKLMRQYAQSIPLLMVLSGGYQKSNAFVISRSLQGLI